MDVVDGIYQTRCSHGGFVQCRPDWDWPKAGPFEDWDLWAVHGGTAWVKGEEGEFELTPGSAVLMRPGKTYRFSHDPNNPVLVSYCHFVFEVDEPPHGFYGRVDYPVFFRTLMERSLYALSTGNLNLANHWFASGLQEWFQCSLQDGIGFENIDPDQVKRIREIVQLMRLHPERQLTIDGLAGHCHLSPDHFTRLFKQVVGETPKDLMIRLRLERAQHLLLSSGYGVQAIAEQLGYRDVYYFSKQFKDRVGMSPLQFRRSKTAQNKKKK